MNLSKKLAGPITALSGVWEGTASITQMGRCPIGHSGRSDPVVLTLEVAPDGSFKATTGRDNPKVTNAFYWTGKLDKNLIITATLTGKATCQGQLREYKSNYSGKITEKKGRFHLKIEGIDKPCSAYECRFKAIHQVKQK
jgi:hypothetical protein